VVRRRVHGDPIEDFARVVSADDGARRAVPGAELGDGGLGTTPDHRQEGRHAVLVCDRHAARDRGFGNI
jgi:hypothetical protein